MKFGVVNKSTTLNRFVLHTLQRHITRLAVITCKTNIKLGILKGGLEKSRKINLKKGRPIFPKFSVPEKILDPPLIENNLDLVNCPPVFERCSLSPYVRIFDNYFCIKYAFQKCHQLIGFSFSRVRI